jgi:aspartate racemase
LYKSYIRYIKRSPQELRLLDVLKANSQASGSYVPQVYTGQLTLFRASRRSVRLDYKPDLGWGELALGGVEIHEVPGSHLGATGIMWEPNVRLLAEKLKPCLEKAQAENGKINSH